MNKMVQFQILTLLILAFVSTSGFAGTTKCSSADQTLKFYESRPDGGAPRLPIIEVKLGSNVVFSSEISGPGIATAKYSFDGKTESEIYSKVQGNVETIVYIVKLSVVQNSDLKTLFEDYVLCQNVINRGIFP